MTVTLSNVVNYAESTLHYLLNFGIYQQLSSFRVGFQEIMPLRNLWVLSVDEVSSLLHGDSEEWTPDVLRASVRCDHGYNAGSPAIVMLFDIISAFDDKERRMLMQFITGAPCLPIGE